MTDKQIEAARKLYQIGERFHTRIGQMNRKILTTNYRAER